MVPSGDCHGVKRRAHLERTFDQTTDVTAALVTVSAVLGLVVGSFLNVVAYRVPRGEPLLRPASHCVACAVPVAARDNIPVVSWVVLRARCRSCGAPISWAYPAVEALSAVLFALLALRFGATVELLAYWVMTSGLLAVSVVDIRQMIVPRRILYPTLALGGALLVAASLVQGQPGRLAVATATGSACFAFFLALHLLVRGGMGFGDVRLAAFSGAFLGWLSALSVLIGMMTAFLTASLVGLGFIAAGRMGRRSKIPFGPFLSAGTVLAVLLGTQISGLWLG